METCLDLTAVVDEYAAVKAKIADLEEQSDTLKAILVASQERQLKGTAHKVSISWVCPKPAPDYKGIVEYLRVGPETLALFMVEKSPYPTVKLYGR